MQELWTIRLSWNVPLSFNATSKWNTYINALKDMPQFTFPRWLGCKSTCSVEIHGFCDASQHVMVASVYMRSTKEEGIVTTNLIAAKTKVAPLKRFTIPRLELSSAILLTKLVAHVLKILEDVNVAIYLWTDSLITHTWINNHPSRWKEFIHNRVCYIQETIPQAH